MTPPARHGQCVAMCCVLCIINDVFMPCQNLLPGLVVTGIDYYYEACGV